MKLSNGFVMSSAARLAPQGGMLILCMGRFFGRMARYWPAVLFGLMQSVHAVTLATINEVAPANHIASTQFRNGYLMAIDEINASGGILGEQILVKESATNNSDEVIAKATQQAIQSQPFAIIGPISTGIALSSLQLTRNGPIPRFTGAEGNSLFIEYSKSTFRTSMSQRMTIPRLVAFTTQALQAKKMGVIWVDNQFGRDGRDLIAEAARIKGVKVGLSVGIQAGKNDFEAVAEKVAASDIDALIIYTNEGEVPGILATLRQYKFQKPIIGDAPLVSASIREKAGAAADGVFVHTGMFPELQIPRLLEFQEHYLKRFGMLPDHNALKGYNTIVIIKMACERIGRFDQARFNELMQTANFDVNKNRQLLFSMSYFPYGEAAKDSYLAQIRSGRLVVIGTIPSTGEGVILPSGETVLMYKKEGREKLLPALPK